MYLAWGGICLGYGILVNTWWALILLPPLLLSTHRTILREERDLERRSRAAPDGQTPVELRTYPLFGDESRIIPVP